MARLRLLLALIALNVLLFVTPAQAERIHASPMITGPMGLNTVPSARMAPAGTASFGVSTLDPYAHGYIGFQIAEPLYINLRQSAEMSNLNEDADRLFPGMDLKLRLLEESAYVPALSIGLQSLVGHKRMAGEYVALSKRHNDFDFTLGMGWGRYGTAGHFSNPLKGLFSHFGKRRGTDGEFPNEPDDWFTGEKIGFFGGIEYFTPYDGLSLKLDVGADRYSAEQSSFNFETPAPWGIGINYKPTDWADISIGAQGTEKVMGRLSLHAPINGWPFGKDTGAAPYMRPYRTELALPAHMQMSAQNDNIHLYDVKSDNLYKVSANLEIAPGTPTPQQIGRAIRHMSNHAGPAVEEFEIRPTSMNLRGPSVSLMRRDVEMAVTRNQGSPQEIWHSASFTLGNQEQPQHFMSSHQPTNLHLLLDNDVSLSEEDHGLLYRTSLIGEGRMSNFLGLITSGAALRLNVHDNLDKLDKFRPRALLPVRSNVDDFASKNTFSLDRSYIAATRSFTPQLHGQLSAGYLEEMYAGLGGEILYRPFASRLAFGGELWQVFKRDPNASFNLGFNGDRLLTGHLNAWYDIPGYDVTLHAKAGRYLAEDIGGTLSLEKRFNNGARLDAFVTATDRADFDLFGGTSHAYHGVRLSVPLWQEEKSRKWASARVNVLPLGRDTGQALDAPISLYEETDAFSARHLIEHWGSVVD